jgi:hypothetical protein
VSKDFYFTSGNMTLPVPDEDDILPKTERYDDNRFDSLEITKKNKTLKVSVKRRSKGENSGKEAVSTGGGERGKIKKYTKSSHKNFIEKLSNSIHQMEIIIHLTYPADYPTDGKIIKYHRKRFVQWINRTHDGGYIWCLEFQKRGAPHFHVLVDRQIPYQEVAEKWYDIVDSEDEKHLEAGTSVESIRNKEGMKWYMADYLSKWQQKQVPDDYVNVGRFWCASRGIDGRSVRKVYGSSNSISDLLGSDVLRILKSWNRKQRKKYGSSSSSSNPYVTNYEGFKIYEADRILSELEDRDMLPDFLK